MTKKYEIKPSAEGIFALAKEKNCKVNSVKVAEVLEIEHSKLMRTIEEKIIANGSGWSEDFNTANFGGINYKDSRGRKQKSYDMTRDGLTAVFMSYNTPKANQLKEKYIKAFNTMEEMLHSIYEHRNTFPKMTDAIQRNFSEDEIRDKFIYARECNLIYMIVFGHNRKWLADKLHLEEGQNVLSAIKDKTAIDNCVWLEGTNATLIDLGMYDYQERKDKLTSLLIKKLGHELEEYRLEEEFERIS